MSPPAMKSHSTYSASPNSEDIDYFHVSKPKETLSALNSILPEPHHFPDNAMSHQHVLLVCISQCVDAGADVLSVVALYGRDNIWKDRKWDEDEFSVTARVVEPSTLKAWIKGDDGSLDGLFSDSRKIRKVAREHGIFYNMVARQFHEVVDLQFGDGPQDRRLESTEQDEQVYVMLQAIRGHLDRLREASPKNYPRKEDHLKVLKTELTEVGNFINLKSWGQSGLKHQFW
ncbi:uncharacterized protein BDZ99DRAFT_461174 [Mytilinidion resinicola]|uniref:Chromodomain-helicase-DNA-binding protein 1-like C-terminal domain-containing protein n=1 Tax=Mytilinidion resinicola TaxID=574789 RepID=A0A6A6YU61_9PEZI|nr:uncharacterized protein BDZ99DRAFT_461174 [Mytilinidion resinicola]KAF2812496.1 hypothetical protein BDZ99DRAFT_461174 [Mytilinidion resinicola]